MVINYDAKYVEVIRVVVMLCSEGENTFVSKKSNTNMVMGVNKFMAEKRRGTKRKLRGILERLFYKMGTYHDFSLVSLS